jgi:hypothetical protein
MSEYKKEFLREKYTEKAARGLWKKYKEYQLDYDVSDALSRWFNEFYIEEQEEIDTESYRPEECDPFPYFEGAW